MKTILISSSCISSPIAPQELSQQLWLGRLLLFRPDDIKILCREIKSRHDEITILFPTGTFRLAHAHWLPSLQIGHASDVSPIHDFSSLAPEGFR